MKNLKELRKKNGLTMKKVSEHLGMAESSYCLCERGKRKLSFVRLVKLAKLYGCSVADFVDEAEAADE